MKAMHLKHVENDDEEIESLADLCGLDVESFKEFVDAGDYLGLPSNREEGSEWMIIPETTFHRFYEFVEDETDDFVDFTKK